VYDILARRGFHVTIVQQPMTGFALRLVAGTLSWLVGAAGGAGLVVGAGGGMFLVTGSCVILI
jgi:hypothetical protein